MKGFFGYSVAMERKNTAGAGRFLCLVSALVLLASCGGRKEGRQPNQEAEPGKPGPEVPQDTGSLRLGQEEWAAVQSFVQGLAPVQRYSQLFLVNLEGDREFYPVESFWWGESPEQALIPGGYLFFSYNVADSAEEVASFTSSIQNYCLERGEVPPLLAVDQEGGDVSRLRRIASTLPSAQEVALAMDCGQARELYAAQAAQLRLLGFHLNLAPVAEATNGHNSAFLDTRSFGSLPAMEDFARAAVAGFQEGGIGAVAKHFPGNTNDDPHTGLPEIALSREELQELYLEPFRRIIQQSSPWAVLMSHARTASHDKEHPACLSRYWVTEVLRGEFGYEGLVLSDDIFMAALEKNGFPPERSAMMAVEAGVDVIMLSEKKFGPVLRLLLDRSAADAEFKALLDAAVERVLTAKVRCGLLSFERSERGLELVAAQKEVWSQDEFQASYNQGMELYTAAFGGGR